MTRDFSQFLPPSLQQSKPRELSLLEQLGWQNFFAQQISAEDLDQTPPARVIEVHRSGLHIRGEGIDTMLPPDAEVTVGDWVLYDADHPAASRVLERKSLLKRRAPGHDRAVQLIAANLDTGFIVTSCNQDFNIARLERYVALCFEAEVDPVIVLTKPDLCEVDEREAFATQAATISDRVPVVVVNALEGDVTGALAGWCKPGRTVGFLGSSGVGKSTLVNALSGTDAVATQDIREDDSKGRHTTTRRQLHLLEGGCVVLDTPGMRELQLTDVQGGVADVFADLSELAEGCKFRDCQHESEPGCMVLAAVDRGEVDAARVARWLKLAREDAFNSATLAQRKAKGRALSKLVREVKKRKKS
ncbi:ribosome small subunit-dependent GTPase A [Alisedimentitalea sp. MJ-SS2]|uniref:ribosome small subunit-dependent GTPase A n=1 Tax=Aliisedimentitalea sp. MJ-SS2 TaxID=3049795 RepID=UPI002907B87A|nr:ribosome small subunit-dependent GTPase A [Alisedimentitalea sp. MJ-SS2]MDU8927743.1 ribosome small subunit-dependent GTPase A [Alisedimentitalea sp. MJ-SS2]